MSDGEHYRARLAASAARKSLGEWVEEAITEPEHALKRRGTAKDEVAMATVRDVYWDQVLQVIHEASSDESQISDFREVYSRTISEILSQCCALLRLEFARKVKQEPSLVSRKRPYTSRACRG